MHPSSVLKIVSAIGAGVGVRVWCHALRHTRITTAIVNGQAAKLGLDRIQTFSRHKSQATMMKYRDQHERQALHFPSGRDRAPRSTNWERR
jgi:integrase